LANILRSAPNGHFGLRSCIGFNSHAWKYKLPPLPFSQQNGHSEDKITPEIKMSPDTAAAAVTLLTSGLKSSKPPPGDATVPVATVKREMVNSPTDSQGKSQ